MLDRHSFLLSKRVASLAVAASESDEVRSDKSGRRSIDRELAWSAAIINTVLNVTNGSAEMSMHSDGTLYRPCPYQRM